LLFAFAISAAAQFPPPLQPNPKKKKNEDKEPVTQTLPVLKDPPGAIAAETAKLTFQVSPLSAKGLLTPQTRDALNALLKANRGGQIVKLRAFVAGTGDMRRVQTIVSEVFTDKKLPLPALSTVQAGVLPMEGAQVVIESVSVDKKSLHQFGIVFFSGQMGKDAAGAIAALENASKVVGAGGAGMLRVSCFLSSLDQLQAAREGVARSFPSAAANFIQPLRASAEGGAVCEGVGERPKPGDSAALTADAAMVSAPKIVFSGTQMAFRDQDADLRLAYQRLQRALEPVGVSFKDVVFTHTYSLSRRVAERSVAVGGEFFSSDRPKPGTMLLFEGLPSLDASVAIEVVAASN
jgi:enamine deaminase RidA (YjgF/YER057c/UK114 family)